jgi:hypothetical protein
MKEGDDFRFPRRHGFERPFNNLQMVAWFVMLFNVTLCLILVAPLLETVEMAVFLTLFVVTTGVLAYFGYAATISDPTDVVVMTHKTAIADGASFD